MKKRFNLATILASSAIFILVARDNIEFYSPNSLQATTNIQPVEKTQSTSPNNLKLAIEHQEGFFIEPIKPKKLQIPKQYFGNYPNFKYEENDEDFENDDDTLLLARALYGEARREINTNPEYVYMVLASIQNRMEQGKTLREVLLEKTPNLAKNTIAYHYSEFAPNNPMYSKIRNPKDIPNFQKTYALARFFLYGEYKNPFPKVNEIIKFFVSVGNPEEHRTRKEANKYKIPGWAYEKKEDKKTFKLNGKERIPIEPDVKIPIDENLTAYGYSNGYR